MSILFTNSDTGFSEYIIITRMQFRHELSYDLLKSIMVQSNLNRL